MLSTPFVHTGKGSDVFIVASTLSVFRDSTSKMQ